MHDLQSLRCNCDVNVLPSRLPKDNNGHTPCMLLMVPVSDLCTMHATLAWEVSDAAVARALVIARSRTCCCWSLEAVWVPPAADVDAGRGQGHDRAGQLHPVSQVRVTCRKAHGNT